MQKQIRARQVSTPIDDSQLPMIPILRTETSYHILNYTLASSDRYELEPRQVLGPVLTASDR